jgi:hypothetical protein
MTDNKKTPRLDTLLNPTAPLPADDVMIAKALEVLTHSPHGQKLVDLTRKESIEIRLIPTPQPSAYLPDTRLAYIGFNRANPISPSRFILMLAGILREAEQELAGIKMPPFTAPEQEHVKVSLVKHEDKLWYICTVACELNDLNYFTDYKFLEELEKMGYGEVLALYLKQERG